MRGLLNWFLSVRTTSLDIAILIIRLPAGLFLMQYGYEKFSKYSEWSADFPDPLGVGSPLSLALCISAELFAAGLLALGLFTRFALVPLMFNMTVVAFIIHANDPMRQKEHAFTFLFIFIALFLMGPGKYSVDNLFLKKS
jgi:putative oxidoreductase